VGASANGGACASWPLVGCRRARVGGGPAGILPQFHLEVDRRPATKGIERPREGPRRRACAKERGCVFEAAYSRQSTRMSGGRRRSSHAGRRAEGGQGEFFWEEGLREEPARHRRRLRASPGMLLISPGRFYDMQVVRYDQLFETRPSASSRRVDHLASAAGGRYTTPRARGARPFSIQIDSALRRGSRRERRLPPRSPPETFAAWSRPRRGQLRPPGLAAASEFVWGWPGQARTLFLWAVAGTGSAAARAQGLSSSPETKR